ncbi:M56 family metallopeptidase [Patescibacteria group bacterium]|nr:M56 family metallopeptidase [Patescibacteria group bacterium]
MKKININLLKFLGIAIALTGAVGFLVYKFWPLFSHNTIYYCRYFLTGSLINVPPIVHASIITFVFLLFAAILFKMVLIVFQSYKFKKHLSKKITNNEILLPMLEELELTKKVSIVEDEKPFAFCLGLRHPSIYISTKTIKMMTNDELKAILLHEKYHLTKKDGLIMLIASLTKILFPFFPLISDFIQRYKLDREIKADNEVIINLGKEPLVSVLSKLLAFPSIPMLTASAIAESATVEARIKAISISQKSKVKYKKINLFISLVSLVFFGLFLAVPVQANEIHLKDNDIMMLCHDEQCAALCRKSVSTINSKMDYSSYSQKASYPFSSAK